MDPTLPWYRSAIIRQQIVAFLIAGFGLFKFETGLDIDATVGAILAGVAAAVPIWTIVTRLFKHAPNMTVTAAKKEAELRAAGDLPTGPKPTTQRGFFRAPLVLCIALASAAVAFVVLPGCVGTSAAYRAAQSLPDTAYVVTEHFAAVVHEAADLTESPTTPPEVKAALKAAVAAAAPFILGDGTHAGVRTLAQRYAAVKNAANAEELQRAVDAAVLELAKLINAVKAARSPS